MEMHFQLPIYYLFLLLQAALPIWSATTSIPIPTFSALSSTSSTSSVSISANSSSTATSNASSTASTTSTAQFPSLSGYPSCVSNCLDTAISAVNCSSVTDVNCFCNQPNFPAKFENCILSGCPTEVPTAESLAQKFCNIASSTPSLSFEPIPSSTSASSSTSTIPSSSSTAPPTATSSSAGSPSLNFRAVRGSLAALGTTLFGISVGTFLVW